MATTNEMLATGGSGLSPADLVAQVDFDAQDFLRDPWPVYRALRAEAPVVWSERYNGWVFTRHEDIVDALRKDGIRYSASRIAPWLAQVRDAGPDRYPVLFKYFMTQFGDQDGADHARIRRTFMKSFSAKAAQAMRGMAARVIDELLDEVTPGTPAEFISTIGVHLPTRFLAEFIGVPRSQRQNFHEWSVSAQIVLTKAIIDHDDLAQLEAALASMTEVLLDEVDKRRAEPADDLLTLCVKASDIDGRLTPEEVISSTQAITFAAFDTTVHSLSLGLRTLCARPDVVAYMLADEANTLPVVNELLRHISPVRGMIRVAINDFDVHGQSIKAGDIVYLMFDAANHDDRAWGDPDLLRFDRDHLFSLAFGTGPHGCLGQNIARIELTEFFPAVFRRFPNTRIEAHDPQYLPSFVIRGVQELPVTFA